ncbi:MAG: hypothetical protein EA442_01655 [Candidatus Nitrosopelagicus sp.]|nr:MAG: hypothetical protein EA442_01655 [Candidatus Nitrosopelagicus sp.]
MSEIPNQAQLDVIKWLKDTHPEFRTTQKIRALRLREPKKFPYKNKSRLHDEITQDVISAFHELNSYFYYLPIERRMEILQSDDFNRFVTSEWLQTLQAFDIQNEELKKTKAKSRKKKEEKKKEYDEKSTLAYQHYQNLFNIGLEGLIKTMPQDFQYYISEQLKPMFSLMQTIAKFTGGQVPYVHYPDLFNENTIRG